MPVPSALRLLILGAIAGVTLTAGTLASSPASADSVAITNSSAAIKIAHDETGLIAAINAQRATNGLPSLGPDSRLTDLARQRSEDMVSRHYFSHTTPDGASIFDLLDAAGINFGSAGENLAKSSESDPVQASIDGFMKSPSHRDNVLEPSYHRIGVGATLASDGMTYLTVVFMD